MFRFNAHSQSFIHFDLTTHATRTNDRASRVGWEFTGSFRVRYARIARTRYSREKESTGNYFSLVRQYSLATSSGTNLDCCAVLVNTVRTFYRFVQPQPCLRVATLDLNFPQMTVQSTTKL